MRFTLLDLIEWVTVAAALCAVLVLSRGYDDLVEENHRLRESVETTLHMKAGPSQREFVYDVGKMRRIARDSLTRGD